MSAPPASQTAASEWLSSLIFVGKRYRAERQQRWAAGALLALGCLILLEFVADWLWGLPAVVRSCWFVGLFLLIGGWLVAAVKSWRAFPSSGLSARLVERAYPHLQGRLQTLVDWMQPRSSATSRSSVVLRMLQRETTQALEHIQVKRVVQRQATVWLIAVTALFWAMLLAASVTATAGQGLLWARLLVPWGNWPTASLPRLLLIDPPQRVGKGDAVTLKVAWAKARDEQHASTKRRNEAPLFWWKTSRETWKSLPTAWNDSAQAYEVRLPQVNRPFVFHFQGGFRRSIQHSVAVAERPVLAKWKATLIPPAYTGQPVRHWSPDFGPIVALPGTRLRLVLEFEQPLLHGRIEGSAMQDSLSETRVIPRQAKSLGDSSVIELPNRRRWQATVTPVRTGTVVMEAIGTEQLAANLPVIAWSIRPDTPPKLALIEPESGLAVPPNSLLPLRWTVEDDVRLTALEVHWETSTGQKDVISISLPDWQLGGRFLHRLDLEKLGVSSGDAVSWRVRAVDNREPGGPQEAWSELRTLVISSRAEPVESLANRSELKDALATAHRHLTEQVKAARDRHAETMAAATGREPRGKAESSEKLAAETQKLTQELSEVADRLEGDPLLQQLAKDIRQTAIQDVQAASRHFESAEKLGPRDQIAPLSQAVDRLAAAERKLRQAQQDFGILERIESQVMRLAGDADRARKLSEKLQQAALKDKPALDAETAKAAQEEAAALQDRLDDLFNRNPEVAIAAQRVAQEKLSQQTTQLEQLARTEQQLAETISGSSSMPETARESSAEDLKTQQERILGLLNQHRQLLHHAAGVGQTLSASLEAESSLWGELQKMMNDAGQGLSAAHLGQFTQASKHLENTAIQIDRLEKGIANRPESILELGQQLADLEIEARTLAAEWKKRENDAAAAHYVRQRTQTELTRVATQSRQNFRDLAEELSNPPVNLVHPGMAAARASEQLRTAIGQMEATSHQLEQQELTAAEREARQAATQLHQAVAAAKETSPTRRNSPVPDSLGESTADAARRASRAQASLEQALGGRSVGAPNGAAENPSSDDSPSELAEAAAAFREAAAALDRAAQATQGAWQQEGFAQSVPDGANPFANKDSFGQDGEIPGGIDLLLDPTRMTLKDLPNAGKGSFRRWGELPGELRTEILQGAGLKSRPEYARQIRAYFETLASPAQPVTPPIEGR